MTTGLFDFYAHVNSIQKVPELWWVWHSIHFFHNKKIYRELLDFNVRFFIFVSLGTKLLPIQTEA